VETDRRREMAAVADSRNRHAFADVGDRRLKNCCCYFAGQFYCKLILN
jgi:hypothetical protein